MYDDLVKALRETDFGDTCVLCEHEDMCKGNDCIIIQAADAIEELSAKATPKRVGLPVGRDSETHATNAHFALSTSAMTRNTATNAVKR